jgi:hypothetical protein
MKLRMFLSRQVFPSVILLIFYLQTGLSQEIVSSDNKQPGLFFGIGLQPSLSQVRNLGVQYGSDLSSTRKLVLSGTLEFGYFFSKYFGISSGLNYSSYNTQLNIGLYQNHLASIDQDNESYDLQVSGSDINEIQQIGILGIPICLNFRVPLKSDMGLFIQTGISIAVPLRNNYTTSGNFTYKGYFSKYNVVLENLPGYGFSTELPTETDGNLHVKPIINCALASVGFDYLIQRRIQISVAALFTKSLESISEYIPNENYQLSTGQYQLNSLMEGSSKVILQSLGFNIGVRYYITDFSKNKYYSKRKHNKYLKEDPRGEKIYIEK